ncbi:hypothetical protein [Paenibacillus jiagnxiensis]|uniref:hypothetical protein n=1 Tax=Paenibacillus jiagnxiensis TaxID=3228926 RepID=UPI0033A012BD
MNNELKELLRSVIKEELVPINDQLNYLKTEQEGIKGEFVPIHNRLDQVDNRLNQVDNRLDQLKTEQGLIKQAVLDTNERVIKMEAILDNQHKIIELLSARSIQQEAELKRIK